MIREGAKKWEPVITDGKIKERILTRIHSITEELNSLSSSQPSLFGNAGISIFREYLFLFNKNNANHNYSAGLINSCLDAVAETPMSYFFSSGVSGILWAFSHLISIGAINANMDDVIGDEVHKFLIDNAKRDIQIDNYDYFHGGLGVLPYFLERAQNEKCRQNIYEIVMELDNKSEKLPEGIAWLDGFHVLTKKEKRYNLGMAHGMASIIVLLSKVYENNIAKDRVNELLEGCINWILNKRNGSGEYGFFPTTMPQEPPFHSRVSWCYGDMGIIFALLQAGIATNNKVWQETAIDIAINASGRKLPNAGIRDVAICHGMAGNGHLFNRLYNYTGLNEFKTSSEYWFMEALQFYETYGHYKFFMMDDDGTNQRWEVRYDILEGLSGIGLTMISAISDIEPKWDRCFLLS